MEARVTHADATVHRDLIAVGAWRVAFCAHPAFAAVDAARRVKVETIAHALAVAVDETRAVRCIAVWARPARAARALLRRNVACSAVRAVDSDTWTTSASTQAVPPARVAVTAAASAVTTTVVGALAVAAEAIEAAKRVAHADATVHGRLRAVGAWIIACNAHVTLNAADALRRVLVHSITNASAVAIRFTRAVGNGAAIADPPVVACAVESLKVARTVVSTRGHLVTLARPFAAQRTIESILAIAYSAAR